MSFWMVSASLTGSSLYNAASQRSSNVTKGTRLDLQLSEDVDESFVDVSELGPSLLIFVDFGETL